ncbi:unnamed protein product [Bathycoccus prasinos]
MTAWKPSLSRDDEAKKKKAFKREEDAHFNSSKRGGNERDFVVKDDAQYFEDLLFGEECTEEEEEEKPPPVPPKRREHHHRDERFKSRRSQTTTPELPHEEEQQKQKQKQEFENEEYEEMKDVNAIRRLTRPETEVEREVLEIARTSFQRISSINNNKNKKKDAASAQNINNNEKTIATPTLHQITRRESEDEEREREKCFRLKQTIEEMFAKTGREDREVRVATSSKFRGACALRNLVHSYVWIDPEYARVGERAYNEEEMMTMQGRQHAVGSASSYSSRMSSSSSSLPPNELNLQRIIVEADLRSHFVIANATPRLLEIIDFMAVKLNSSFAARKMDTPPWRRAKSIASKWSMPIEEQLINNNGSSSASGSPMNHHATTTASGSSTMYQHQQQNISPQHKHTST